MPRPSVGTLFRILSTQCAQSTSVTKTAVTISFSFSFFSFFTAPETSESPAHRSSAAHRITILFIVLYGFYRFDTVNRG